MSRKRKSTIFEDLVDLVSILPWWAGVLFAVFGYLLLHRLANPAAITAYQPGQMGSFAARAVITAFASVGQYVVVFIGLIGAAISFFCRNKRSALITDVAQAQSTHALDGMSWREFEMLVGEAFRLQGYRVTETGGGGADGGIDLVLSKGAEKFLVQCKQWKAYKVGVDVVRELYGVMAAKGATGGFVVTSGRFTDDASKFAAGRNVRLIDGPKLFALIKQAKQSTKMADQQIGSTPRTVELKAAIELSCPQCGSTMVKRVARKGGNAGSEFWGCSTFPSCRGVRQLG